MQNFLICREKMMTPKMTTRMMMRVRKMTASEKCIMIVLPGFYFIGVCCKWSLGDDGRGHPFWLSTHVGWGYQDQLVVFWLTIIYLSSCEVISGFISSALFQILMTHRLFLCSLGPFWNYTVRLHYLVYSCLVFS